LSKLFFRDFNAIFRRISDVVSLTWIPVASRENPHMLYRVQMENGEYYTVDQENSEVILHGSGEYLPAAPNITIIDVIDDVEDGVETQYVERFPLIGWHISDDDYVTPVTAKYVWPDERDWYAVLADGKVFSSRSNYYESEQALLLHLQNRGLNDNG
jgi:hypothetical protein